MKQIALGRISTIVATVFVAAGVAASASAAPKSGSCPNFNQLGTFKFASNVAANFSNDTTTTTYYFYSLVNEGPTGGVPGLVSTASTRAWMGIP